MVSLTPQVDNEAISNAAFKEGFINGSIALVPSYGIIWMAMKSPKFSKATNWQSRTALVIMPALFTFAFSAERMLDHKMKELANSNEHTRASAAWAEEKHAENVSAAAAAAVQHKEIHSTSNPKLVKDVNTEQQLLQLYRQSVANSGVRIVSSSTLGPHHRVANFWQENPVKVLALMAVPAVGYIYYGRTGKDHLQLQMKIMHTRVMGQFAVITMLLSLMGFKEYMDRQGKFITEDEAERRVTEMTRVREGLLQRLAVEKAARAGVDAQMKKAHDQDVQSGNVHDKKHNKKVNKLAIKELESVATA
mmetsp:Transcript_10730/g.17778  ORF Transcript_10730/g.17778 Transcript_10730/m.17778 type:complete len:306 (+) Transcript_10730:167-1084(+)|eukprot:CAMPEP_0119030410 /NCGR_PEP_ID=MMETSP1176-20130426/41016_1 /TAXON_ID=265551 /ORGANISM="Synedropsis recta cf, Strain CCMP1620" /LENGTH=305 /DNA_ID=CAMNT_0006986781 /DNA_START=152 /DNA_END=1069 /DNA_ORIENTATION=+